MEQTYSQGFTFNTISFLAHALIAYRLTPYPCAAAYRNLSKFRSDGEVVLPAGLWEPLYISSLAEYQTMRRATKVEHAQLFALGDMLPSVDGDLTRADLDHADGDEDHKPDGGVVRFDEDDSASGDGGTVSLARDGTRDVDVIAVLGGGIA